MILNNIQSTNASGLYFTVPDNHACSFSNCIFSSLLRATPISADGVTSSLSFEECLFESIKGDKEGGCIHVNCTLKKTSVSMNKVIGNECETEDRRGSFAHIRTLDNIDMKDVVISKCAPMEINAHYLILANCSKASHQGGNITECLAYSDLLTFQSDESISKWCQFKQNKLKQHGVVIFQTGTHTLQYSTVVDNHNNRPDAGGATIFAYLAKKLSVSNSYFMRNTGSILFSGASSVVNCVVDVWDNDGVASSSGIVNSGTQPETSVIYPIRLKLRCESIARKPVNQILLAKFAFITLLNPKETNIDTFS